jgi:hypothetical protein
MIFLGVPQDPPRDTDSGETVQQDSRRGPIGRVGQIVRGQEFTARESAIAEVKSALYLLA